MASRNATIAEAVKSELNTAAANPATFGATFTATRVYVPVSDLENLKGLTVKVFAAGEEREDLRGGSKLVDIVVEVGIQKRLTKVTDATLPAANTEIDELMELAEKVSDHWAEGELGNTGAQWLSTAMTVPNPEHLQQHRVFTVVITLTFKTLLS